MKKLIKILFIISIIFVFNSNYAQYLPGDTEDDPIVTTSCSLDLMSQLVSCLNEHGVFGSLIQFGDGISLIASSADGPYGLFNSCVVQYNHDRINCPQAPVVVLKYDSKSGKGH